jgi:hypothetical protein
MKHIKLIAATALAMAATPAFAANWAYVTTDRDNSVSYYDSDTIQRSGNQVTFWEKVDRSRDKTVKERQKLVRYRYDCAGRTATLLELIVYYPDGEIETLTLKAYEQEVRAIAPGTTGEMILQAVCAATAP